MKTLHSDHEIGNIRQLTSSVETNYILTVQTNTSVYTVSSVDYVQYSEMVEVENPQH